VKYIIIICIYLLLTEFEVRIVSYGLSFFSLIYGPSAKCAGHESKRKKRGSVTNSTDREDEVSKIFIISLIVPDGFGSDFCSHVAGLNFLHMLEAKRVNMKSFLSPKHT